MNEFAKFVAYKPYADSLIALNEKIIHNQELQLHKLNQALDIYENQTVPNLQSQVEIYENKVFSLEEIMASRKREHETEIKKLKAKRITIGPYVGYGMTPNTLQPSVGVAITYALIRF